MAKLPDGARAVNWHGGDYWRDGGRWYGPVWRGDALWYGAIYPPIGWWTPTIDWGTAETVVYNNTTYYESEGVYYEKTSQNGQEGYAVVEEPAAATQPAAPAQGDVPDPFAVLKSGLDYLPKQNQFTMTASDSYDEVTEDGQKVSYTTRRNIVVRRPGSVAIEFEGDGESRRVVLDNKTLTLVDRTKKAYGQAPMPDTIDAALDKLATDYNITVAVAELLRTNLYDRIAPNIQTGQYIGKDTIGASECHHVAFTTASTDWEAWFDVGDKPMIRKFSISYKEMAGRPRYTMTIPTIDFSEVQDYQLKANIPSGFQQVPLKPVATESPSTKPVAGEAAAR